MNNGVVICHACPIRIRQERRVDVTSLEIQPSTCKEENEWKGEFALFEMIRDGAHRLIVVRSLDSCQVLAGKRSECQSGSMAAVFAVLSG